MRMQPMLLSLHLKPIVFFHGVQGWIACGGDLGLLKVLSVDFRDKQVNSFGSLF